MSSYGRYKNVCPIDELTHVVPVNDSDVHHTGKFSADCPCNPVFEENGRVVIHNAYDGREFSEFIEAKREMR